MSFLAENQFDFQNQFLYGMVNYIYINIRLDYNYS